MRLIKAIIAGATGLFVVITLFSLLIPSNVPVSRTVLINNTSTSAVYLQIANFENWKKWHPVFTVDSADLNCPTPVVDRKDPGCRIIHRGREVIVRKLSADSTSFKFLLQSKGEHDISNDILITPLQSLHSVRVEWRATMKLSWYPWQKFYSIFIDKLTGPGYEAALKGLKEYMEGPPAPNGSPPAPQKGVLVSFQFEDSAYN